MRAILGVSLVVVFCPAPSALAAPLTMPTAAAIHVCKATGNNSNPGTKEKPFKDLDKAATKAKSGDTVLVCEGNQTGTFDIGYFEIDKALKLYGSYAPDFSKRDLVKHTTFIQPDNASGAKSRKALMRLTKEVDGAVIDGFVFDAGQRNSYHRSEGKPQGVETGMLLLPPEKGGDDKPTVTEPCLSIPSAAKEGSLTVSNNVFANCAMFAIQAGLRGGKYTITNNVFVANRMAAAEIYGTCAVKGGGPKARFSHTCGQVEFANNTVLFTWSRVKDFLDMGYGFRIMTLAAYDIHHNLFGGNIQAGIDHTRFSETEIKVDNNAFFVNKAADLEYSPASNTKLTLRADKFGDLQLASVQGNSGQMPKGLPIDKAYLEGLLSARYSEQSDYDPASPANQFREAMGLNKRGKLTTQVSMFANRYPAAAALKLFGGVAGTGAQALD